MLAGAVALDGLATRLFPGHVGGAYEAAGYQLAEPIGYANALAMVVVVGILLAVGFAAHGGRRVQVAGGAMSLVVLLPTLYFTVSRGAIGALVAGFIVHAWPTPGADVY